MKKTKIGIPRAFLYYRYGLLWKKFFSYIGCKVIVSPETNNNIVTVGDKNIPYESCTSLKIYLGHILYLKDKCDYIIICKNCHYESKEKICRKVDEITEIIKYRIDQEKIIEYSFKSCEFLEFIKIGLKITKNIPKIIIGYLIAKKSEKKYHITIENEQRHEIKSSNKKILLISEPYNLIDKYIISNIINYLKSKNITIIYSNKINAKIASRFYQKTKRIPSYSFIKELLGTIDYYKYMIEGIIYITTKSCIYDKIISEEIENMIDNLPYKRIIINEIAETERIETTLESILTSIY